MLRDGRRKQQEEQPGRDAVNGVVGNSPRVPSKDDQGVIHEPHQSVARVRQGDAVTDAGAVELLAFAQRPQQRLPRCRFFASCGIWLTNSLSTASGPRSANPD